MTRHLLATVAALLLLTACATQPDLRFAGDTCATDRFSVEEDFAGGQRGVCVVDGAGKISLFLHREDPAVSNPSPWFAFRLVPASPGSATVTLNYGSWKHRYIPKFSLDGKIWARIPAEDLVSENENRLTLTIDLGSKPIWISAQELLDLEQTEIWSRQIAARTDARLGVLGRSNTDLPIYKLESGRDLRNVVLLTARQHPPEVSGVFAFFAFFDTLMADSELATEFREHFRIIALPLLNPDGVVNGHWRHNLGQKDLNRDWGPFTQTETKLVFSLLSNLEHRGADVRMFMDFHSTNRNVFYTPSNETNPPGFIEEWLSRSEPRISNYEFKNDAKPVSEQANSKNYMYKRYGIPALTYEVGDETNRDAAMDAARVFAEEFMRLWLEVIAQEQD